MKNIFDLKGKVAIVTGASSGLGVQFANILADYGADLVLTARRIDKVEELAKSLKDKGVKTIAVKCDVTKSDEVKNVVDKAIAEFGKVDILVNNAGIAAGGKIEKLPEKNWDLVMDTNAKGVYLFAKHVAPHMKEKGYGRIINIASMFGLIGNKALPVSDYHASKGAVVNFTKALGSELAKTGVTVNAIGPGFFQSEMTQDMLATDEFMQFLKGRCPMERPGKEGELNGILIYLTSDSSSYTTGQTIYVDGGWTAS